MLLAGFLLKAYEGEIDRARKIFECALKGKDDVRKRQRECFDQTLRKQSGEREGRVSGVRKFAKDFPDGEKIADWALGLLGKKQAKEPSAADDASLAARVLETNEEFAVMSVGCKVAVAQFGDDGEITEFWSPEEFAKYMRGVRKEKGVATGGFGATPYGTAWFGHADGRSYDRLVYAMPGSGAACGPRDYNGWHGFTVEPQAGDWSKNRGHMRDVICAGDEAHFAWLFNWCAALVQKPGQHTGKGHFVVRMLGALFHKQQFIHLASSSQLVENFNEHLSGMLLEARIDSLKGDAAALRDLLRASARTSCRQERAGARVARRAADADRGCEGRRRRQRTARHAGRAPRVQEVRTDMTHIDQDKELAELLAAQRGVPAEAAGAKSRLEEAQEKFAAARKYFHGVSARASLGQASKTEAKAAERAMDEAADELRKAEDQVEILSEKVAILATAISQTKARRRARVLPDVKAEGERIAGEAAAAFAILTRLADEARALKSIIDGDFVLDVTASGHGVPAPELAQLGSAPAVASFLASRTFKELTLDKFERVAK
jgi:hypothetical protein